MKPRKDLVAIGAFAKPHGVKGELSAVFDADTIDAVPTCRCVFVDIDGLLVPFFIDAVRPKSAEVLLIKLKGVDSEVAAARFANKQIFAEPSELPDFDADDADDNSNFYLEDLIGYTVIADGSRVGQVEDFDDATENVLFIVKTPDGAELLIPASDDFITGIDPEALTIEMSLPGGLLNLSEI